MKKIYLVLLVLFSLYIFFGWAMLDPDFGWRIKIGQLMMKNGIYSADPFSFSMTKYPFVDHEWLTHIGIAAFYKIANNNLILLFIFGLIATLSLFFSIPHEVERKKGDWLIPSLIFLIGSSLFSYSGIRPQVWGWLLLALWVGELRKGDKANFILLLFLQLLWVNTHGSYFLGVATYLLFVFSQFVQKKEIGRDIGRFILLCGSTLLNPYGWRMWWEVWMQLTDFELKWRIQEWQPGLITLNISYLFYCALFLSLFIKYWKKISLFNRIITLSFFLLSLSAMRNIPLFLISSFLVYLQMWCYLEADIHHCMKKQFIRLQNIIIILCFFVGFTHICYDISLIQPLNKVYPVAAVNFITKNKIEGRVFAEYAWGGYLIWKAPLIKIFIDGRMPSWRWKQTDPHQSNDSAKEYFYITRKYPSFEPYRKKYDISYVLIKKGDKKNIFASYKKLYEDNICFLYKIDGPPPIR